MTEALLERFYEKPLNKDMVYDMVGQTSHCFLVRNVDWRCSFLSSDGHTLLCWFDSPDLESIRSAVRESGSEYRSLSACTVHSSAKDGELLPNIVVTRSWQDPVALEDIQAIEDKGSWCLETHNVTFIRTYFTADRCRMTCLYSAPDAESVRLAQRQAGMPFDDVWPMQPILPA